MANYNLKITHLCVGLGLSVLIELDYTHPTTGAGRFVGLLDCGSITGGRMFYESALQQINTAVNQNGGHIDYLHISHFDEDHYNLLGKMGESYRNTYHTKIIVNKLFFGCIGDKDPAKIAAKIRQSFVVYNLYELTNNFYHRPGAVYFYPQPGVPGGFLYENIELDNNLYFRICPILYHAHLIPVHYRLTDIKIQDAGVKINTGSSILLVTIVEEIVAGGVIHDMPYVSYVFTGDATLETMKILQKAGILFGQEHKVILVPHHGAKRHVSDNENTNDYATLKWFLGLVSPTGAVVSAKCKNQAGWSHPHSDTMDVYADYLPKLFGCKHNLTGFYWDNANGRMIVRQGTMDSLFYQTFRLDGTVQDRTFYGNCAKSSYERIDVVMTSDSTDPRNFAITENIR